VVVAIIVRPPLEVGGRTDRQPEGSVGCVRANYGSVVDSQHLSRRGVKSVVGARHQRAVAD